MKTANERKKITSQSKKILLCVSIILSSYVFESRPLLSLFVLFWTVLDKPGELNIVEVSVFIDILFCEHFIEFFFREAFTHRRQKSLQFLSWDHFCAIRVEAFERVLDNIFRVGSV